MAFRGKSLDLTDDICHQATSCYLNQCWPRSLTTLAYLSKLNWIFPRKSMGLLEISRVIQQLCFRLPTQSLHQSNYTPCSSYQYNNMTTVFNGTMLMKVFDCPSMNPKCFDFDENSPKCFDFDENSIINCILSCQIITPCAAGDVNFVKGITFLFQSLIIRKSWVNWYPFQDMHKYWIAD